MYDRKATEIKVRIVQLSSVNVLFFIKIFPNLAFLIAAMGECQDPEQNTGDWSWLSMHHLINLSGVYHQPNKHFQLKNIFYAKHEGRVISHGSPNRNNLYISTARMVSCEVPWCSLFAENAVRKLATAYIKWLYASPFLSWNSFYTLENPLTCMVSSAMFSIASFTTDGSVLFRSLVFLPQKAASVKLSSSRFFLQSLAFPSSVWEITHQCLNPRSCNLR